MPRPNDSLVTFVTEPSAPPKGNILFVHDALHGAWCWNEYLAKDFSDRGFRCISFNLPGHGFATEASDADAYGFQDYVDALAVAVDKCDDSPVIIGHGMGALVLQLYLQRHTCRMAIFMAPLPPNGYWNRLLRLLVNIGTWKAFRHRKLYEIVRKPSTAKKMFFSPDTESAQAQKWHARLGHTSYRVLKEWKKLDIQPISHAMTPTLVIGGGKDPLVSVKDFKRTADKHDAPLVIVPHMGHDMMLDQGHAWLTDLLINCMDFPVEQTPLPVVHRLRVASHQYQEELETIMN